MLAGTSVLVGCAAVSFGCAPAGEIVGVLVAAAAAPVVAVAATGDVVGVSIVALTAGAGRLDNTAAGTISGPPEVLRSRSAACAASGANGGRFGSAAWSHGR